MMKNFVYFFLLIPILVSAQDMKLKNPDKTINLSFIKSGTFIQEIKHPKAAAGYYMVLKDSIRYEYSENGKYVTKSKIIFMNDDSYKSVAFETNKPGFSCHLNEIVETKILQTSTKDSLIRTKERINRGKWQKFVLRKLGN
jgi:hypothetical protein